MRSPVILVTALAVTAGAFGVTTAHAQVAVPVTTTVLPGGLLTLAGAGAAVSVAAKPGEISEAFGATALTVSDLRGTSAGWSVTATYSDPTQQALDAVTGGKALGGGNIMVSSGDLTGELAGSTALGLVTDEPLSSPVTVASTGLAGGSGVTGMTGTFKTRVPQTAQTVDVFLGTVTYTVATVR